MAPFTQRMNLAWRPALGFFERRYEVLRTLEDDGLLRSFQVRENRISVRLGDPLHVLVFGPESAEVMLLGPDGEFERLMSALETVLRTIRPAGSTRIVIGAQWLERLEIPYKDARHAAASRILGEDGDITDRDFALLTSGELSEPRVAFDLEIGVVEAAEIPQRLARQAGRIGKVAPEVPPSLWPTESLPDVALFADSTWRPESPINEPTLDEIRSTWDATVMAATLTISNVFERFRPRGEPT